jgi:hypothetical protein
MGVRCLSVKPGTFGEWLGNNAAFICPGKNCGQVYIVSGFLNRSGRDCPRCHLSKGFVYGSSKKGGEASIVWGRELVNARQ